MGKDSGHQYKQKTKAKQDMSFIIHDLIYKFILFKYMFFYH